jgi:hypothetical protein
MSAKDGWTIDDYKRWLVGDLGLRKEQVPTLSAIITQLSPAQVTAFQIGYRHGMQMAIQVVKLVDPRDGGCDGECGGERGSAGDGGLGGV